MPIDDALEDMRKQDELKRLIEMKRRSEDELTRQRAKIEDLKGRLMDYQKELEKVTGNQQDEIIKAHLRALSNFWPEKEATDEVGQAVIRLVSSPEFVDIYKNALILRNPMRRFEYVVMRGLMNGSVNMAMDRTKFFSKLSPLGLNILCPYFECSRSFWPGKIEYDKCLIDGGEGINALCDGRYDICVIFKDRVTRFATGEIPYVAPRNFNGPKLLCSEEERERLEKILLKEIEKYWRDED